MSAKDKVVLFTSVNGYFAIFISVMIFFSYSYTYKFYLIENRSNSPDDIVETAATRELEQKLNGVGFIDLTNDSDSKIRVFIKPENGVEQAMITTPDGKFFVDIYTMRDFDLDLGLSPKYYGEYPEITCTTIGQFSTGGILIETIQRDGVESYVNRIYIKDDKVVDVGFFKKIGINDDIVYYDNTVLIINTLRGEYNDILRVYDDETTEIIFSFKGYNDEVRALDLDVLMCEAVGENFISFSSKYYNDTQEYYMDFNEDDIRVHSVWDFLSPNEYDVEQLKYYETITEGHTLEFKERNYKNQLVYNINDIVNDEVIFQIKIQLSGSQENLVVYDDEY